MLNNRSISAGLKNGIGEVGVSGAIKSISNKNSLDAGYLNNLIENNKLPTNVARGISNDISISGSVYDKNRYLNNISPIGSIKSDKNILNMSKEIVNTKSKADIMDNNRFSIAETVMFMNA